MPKQSYGRTANAEYKVIFPGGVADKFGLLPWEEGNLVSKKSVALSSNYFTKKPWQNI